MGKALCLSGPGPVSSCRTVVFIVCKYEGA